MRGIVTLATAFALPVGFPQRDLIVLSAFCVVLGTLVLQGLTLRPLLSRLVLPPDQSVESEVALARAETAAAALEALAAAAGDGNEQAEAQRLLEWEYRARLEASARSSGGAVDPTRIRALRRIAVAAERARLFTLRSEERIGDDAFHRVEGTTRLDGSSGGWVEIVGPQHAHPRVADGGLRHGEHQRSVWCSERRPILWTARLVCDQQPIAIQASPCRPLIAKRIDQQGEGRRRLPAARVVQVVARKRRAPVGKHPHRAVLPRHGPAPGPRERKPGQTLPAPPGG